MGARTPTGYYHEQSTVIKSHIILERLINKGIKLTAQKHNGVIYITDETNGHTGWGGNICQALEDLKERR
jgi:hypothetical protein